VTITFIVAADKFDSTRVRTEDPGASACPSHVPIRREPGLDPGAARAGKPVSGPSGREGRERNPPEERPGKLLAVLDPFALTIKLSRASSSLAWRRMGHGGSFRRSIRPRLLHFDSRCWRLGPRTCAAALIEPHSADRPEEDLAGGLLHLFGEGSCGNRRSAESRRLEDNAWPAVRLGRRPASELPVAFEPAPHAGS
jgi:hypothetical protein